MIPLGDAVRKYGGDEEGFRRQVGIREIPLTSSERKFVCFAIDRVIEDVSSGRKTHSQEGLISLYNAKEKLGCELQGRSTYD